MSTGPLFDVKTLQALGRKVDKAIDASFEDDDSDFGVELQGRLLHAARMVLALSAASARSHGAPDLVQHVIWWVSLANQLDDYTADEGSTPDIVRDAIGALLEAGAPLDASVRALAESPRPNRRHVVAAHLRPVTEEAVDLVARLAADRVLWVRRAARKNLGLSAPGEDLARDTNLSTVALYEKLLALAEADGSPPDVVEHLRTQLTNLQAEIQRVPAALADRANVPRWVGLVAADPRPGLTENARAAWERIEAILTGKECDLGKLASSLVGDIAQLPDALALELLGNLLCNASARGTALCEAVLARPGGETVALDAFRVIDRSTDMGGEYWFSDLWERADEAARGRLLDAAVAASPAMLAEPPVSRWRSTARSLARALKKCWPVERDASPLIELALHPGVEAHDGIMYSFNDVIGRDGQRLDAARERIQAARIEGFPGPWQRLAGTLEKVLVPA